MGAVYRARPLPTTSRPPRDAARRDREAEEKLRRGAPVAEREPEWTDRAGMVAQQRSANKWAKETERNPRGPGAPAGGKNKYAKEIDPDLPIVIITGYPDSQMLDNILKLGPVTVLKKPLQVEQLNQTLRIMGHKASAKAA